jgi:endoglucanase
MIKTTRGIIKIAKLGNVGVVALLTIMVLIIGLAFKHGQTSAPAASRAVAVTPTKGNLAGRHFYNDPDRPIVKVMTQYKAAGQTSDAKLLALIAAQPGTTWLYGPSANDTTAAHDIVAVDRTSRAAAANGTTPIYELYALPNRDVCAGYSKAGFTTDVDYLNWIDRIIASLHGDAVFSVEADGIAQTLNGGCMTPAQISDRYALLRSTVAKLKASPRTAAIYLDAGNPEWFPDPNVLVGPLKRSGIDQATGVAVNVSNFVDTKQSISWSQKLTSLFGDTTGAIIDTSRNGNGVAAASITGDGRYCNPLGRAIGPAPTTYVAAAHIDAYFWGKNIGESDGACAGNPPAGSFVPALALALAKNTKR